MLLQMKNPKSKLWDLQGQVKSQLERTLKLRSTVFQLSELLVNNRISLINYAKSRNKQFQYKELSQL